MSLFFFFISNVRAKYDYLICCILREKSYLFLASFFLMKSYFMCPCRAAAMVSDSLSCSYARWLFLFLSFIYLFCSERGFGENMTELKGMREEMEQAGAREKSWNERSQEQTHWILRSNNTSDPSCSFMWGFIYVTKYFWDSAFSLYAVCQNVNQMSLISFVIVWKWL